MARLSAYGRLVRAGWIMTREGVVAALPSEGLPAGAGFAHRMARILARRRVHGSGRSERFSNAASRLGPSYIKLGQFLATRPDVVGAEIADDLAHLHDQLAPFPTSKAQRIVEASLGRPMDDLYVYFDEPVAAASIAQVHPAGVDTKSGVNKVAVKVVRPGVRKRFANDLETFFLVAEFQERHISASRRLRPVEVTNTLAQTTRLEMDMRLEAAALSELAENICQDKGFRVPSVDWTRTGRDVLTMEWIDGIKMSRVASLSEAGFDLKHLADTLIQSFLRHTLRDGFFHADMHQGNLFVDPDGVIVAVDMGIVGRLGRKERRFLAEILYGFIKGDYRRVADVHFEAGYVPDHHDPASFAQAIRAIGEPIHGQSAETISMAQLLTLLFEVTQLFDMETRPELILLQKTMVVVEGVARSLDPTFNMWKAAEPVVGGWIATNLGPRGVADDAVHGLSAAASLLRQAPELARRARRLSENVDEMVENGLHLDAETTEAIGRAEARHTRSGRVALWVAAIALVAIAVQIAG